MSQLFVSLLFVLVLLLSGCKSNEPSSVDLPQNEDIQVYFNHRDTGNTKYQEPYRDLSRTGDDLAAIVVQQIEQARFTIDVAVQELQLPNIAQALAKKAQDGVKVKVILDNKYSKPISEFTSAEIERLPKRERDRYQQYFQLIDIDSSGFLTDSEINNRDALIILERANVSVMDDTADGSKGSGLMHHKFIVVDNKTIVTGSANFTLSGIYGDLNNIDTRGNVNHLLVINNNNVAEIFTKEFNLMWQEKEFGSSKMLRHPQTVSWQDSKVTVQFSPISSKQDWWLSGNGLIGQSLQEANNSIDMALFVFSEQKLADILENKQQQGVKIKALIDREFIFRYYSEALDMLGVAIARKCQYEANNKPWNNAIKTVGTVNLATGDKLHHKLAIVDDDTVITGSQNWSAAANYTNDETILVIKNNTVAKHFQQEFDYLYQNANLGLPEKVQAKIKQNQTECL